MHIAIFHHDTLSTSLGPQSGATIRLHHIVQGLQNKLPAATFSFLCKSDTEGNWKEHIHRHIDAATPDVIFCAQMDDATLLPARESLNIPVVVDFYAPRLLETLFEPDQGMVSHCILRAIDRSDAYLIAHEGQREHWQALFRLMGVAELEERTLIVPLGVEVAEHTTPDELTLVGGGRVWPWQNPWDNLNRLLAVLDTEQRGCVVWFSPPEQPVPIEHPRLKIHPWTSRSAYRAVISKATLGLDLNPNSAERKLACAFRHMDFIGCGIPILSANENILSRYHPKLCQYIDFQDMASVQKALRYRAPQNTLKRFQTDHAPAQAVTQLEQWLRNPTIRQSTQHVISHALHPVQESFNAQSKRLELENEIVQLRLTHEAQTKMLEESNQQLQQSTSSLLKVSTALEQVSAFKNDIAHNWTALMHQQQERIQALETALRDAESNNAKKSAELHAMDLLRARLENDLQHTREELQRQKNKPRWKR